MNLHIKIAGTEDATLVAALSRDTFYETFASYNTKENMDRFMNEQFTMEKLVAEVGAPGNLFLLAFDGEQPAGYVRLREGKSLPELNGKEALEISRIYVLSRYFGKQAGKQLLEAALKLATERQKQVVWLGVWEKNERAIAFYRKNGFEKFSEHEFLLGEDRQTDWLMKKEI